MLGRANPASFAWDDIDHPILMLASEFNTLAILVVLDGNSIGHTDPLLLFS